MARWIAWCVLVGLLEISNARKKYIMFDSSAVSVAEPASDALPDHDHRKIGAQLDLFHMRPEAPGMVFWHPRGFAIYRALEDAVRREMRRQGLEEVRSPQLLRQSVWEASGHWNHFRDNMFAVDEDRVAALKPVSCPAHLFIAKSRRISYRELPLRLGEIGIVHRNERSGNLHGLFRLRQFSQDDGHILCAPDQVVAEVARFCMRLRDFYAVFDFPEPEVGLSTRPADRMGDDASWDRAEGMLRDAAREAGIHFVEQPGEGAFYGPKLEIALRDRHGRRWQCGTMQIDLAMPARFDVSYVSDSDARERPVLLHRALLGSLERFLGILLEHVEGHLPAWLASQQAVVLPIKEGQGSAARAFADELARVGIRAKADVRNETLGKRLLMARKDRVPLAAIIGPRELERGQVSLRDGDESVVLSRADAAQAIVSRCAAPI